MKKAILFFSIALAAISCSNNSDEQPISEGTWNWIATSDGSTGTVLHTPASSGITRVLALKSANAYDVTENGIVVSSGTYSVTQKTSVLDGKSHEFIDFSNNPDKMVHSVTNKKLFLRDDTPTGVVDEYERK